MQTHEQIHLDAELRELLRHAIDRRVRELCPYIDEETGRLVDIGARGPHEKPRRPRYWRGR